MRNLLVLLISFGLTTNNYHVKAFTNNKIKTFLPKVAPPLSMSTTTTTTIENPTTPTKTTITHQPNEITPTNPLRVIIAGGGVGGLTLANSLTTHSNPNVQVTILEKTDQFKRFGGPIQLASNALQILSTIDSNVYESILSNLTFTGDKVNGIKDGIRDEWYAKFDLGTPAENRNMPYTGVIERPVLQQIYLDVLEDDVVKNGDGVIGYEELPDGGGVKVLMESGEVMEGDVLIGADGIWSSVRASMRDEPSRGDGSGVSYSGYTVFAGELDYDSFDVGKVGYKVYIGPKQYFVITDIGNGRYQWYAFLARAAGSKEEGAKGGTSEYLQDIFVGWSNDIHHILKATTEQEIEQRDLYDRPPSVIRPWTSKNVALLGDSVHAMMPNLGQGGCQAIEDAYVLSQELSSLKYRSDIESHLTNYRQRRLIRSAVVQGLSRFASDIIIRGFDTPAKIVKDEDTGNIRFENFNYAGIVTKVLQPILPLFFSIQFNFLYEGWENEMAIDVGAALGFLTIGGLCALLLFGTLGEGAFGVGALGLDALFGGEGLEALFANMQDFFNFF